MSPTPRPPIRLDLNTGPLLNEAAILRAQRGATARELAMYPEPGAPDLTRAIAERVHVPVDRVLVGNGSDDGSPGNSGGTNDGEGTAPGNPGNKGGKAK